MNLTGGYRLLWCTACPPVGTGMRTTRKKREGNMDAVTRAARQWEDAEKMSQLAWEDVTRAKAAYQRAKQAERAAARRFLRAEKGQSSEYTRLGETPRTAVGRLALTPVCRACRTPVGVDTQGYPHCSLDGDEFICESCVYEARGETP